MSLPIRQAENGGSDQIRGSCSCPNPGVAAAADSSAFRLFQDRKFTEAERAYRLALRHQPRNSDLRLGLARTLVELDRIPEALQILEATLGTAHSDLGPTPAIEMELGRLLRQLAEKRFML